MSDTLIVSTAEMIPGAQQRLMDELSSDDKLIHYYLNRTTKRRTGKLSARTAREYERDIKSFLLYIGNIPLRSVNTLDIEGYAEYLASRKLSESTRQRMLNSVRGLFRYGHELGYFPTNPALLVHPPRPEIKFGIHTLSLEQLNLIIETSKRKLPHYLMVSVLATTGLRVQEFCGANWGDLYTDMDGNIGLRVRKEVAKGGKSRVVKIRRDVYSILMEYRISRGLRPQLDPTDKTPLLFTKRGTRYTPDGIRDMMERIVKRAGLNIKVTPHWMRHTFATIIANNNGPLNRLQAALGHTDLRTTQIYLHTSQELKDSAADFLSGVKI